jgi:hypothetical protein
MGQLAVAILGLTANTSIAATTRADPADTTDDHEP